jgi:hypothetical protein
MTSAARPLRIGATFRTAALFKAAALFRLHPHFTVKTRTSAIQIRTSRPKSARHGVRG